MVRCEICEKEFSTGAALAQHMKDKHGQSEGMPSPKGAETRKETTRGSKPKQRSLRKKNRHPVAIGLAGVAIAVGLGLYILVAPSFAATPVPCLTGENYIHVHPYVRISVEGINVPIPAQLGFVKSNTCIEEIHTHDASGIIHIELSQTDANQNYTLGDLFRVWNFTYPTVLFNGTSHPVTFSNTGIFGYKVDATHKLLVLVDNVTVANGVGIPIEQYDYCDSTNSGVPPCSPTAGGNPVWNGGPYPFATKHTIVIEYVKA